MIMINKTLIEGVMGYRQSNSPQRSKLAVTKLMQQTK